MGLYDFTFYDLINRNAVSFGARDAWFEADAGRTLSFSEIKENVDRLAEGLQKLGIKKGDRIGIYGKNSLEYFLLYGASAALGVIVLPINWRLSAEEAVYNFKDCEPRVVFADPEYGDAVEGMKGRLPFVEHYFNLGEDGPFTGLGSLMEGKGIFQPVEVASDDGFVIIHTAAVAGRPRGALLSHGNVLCANMHFDYLMGLTAKDVHLSILPFFHVGGLFMATTCFHAGALNVSMSKFEAAAATDLIQDKGVTTMFDFSPILSSILEQKEKTGQDISTLRAVAGLEAPETIEKYQEVTGGTFYCMYGQTETSCVATFGAYGDKPGSAGRMLPLAEVRLVDDYDKPVSRGRVGEICVKGPMVFKGYWNLPEDTAYTFREGWHHMGIRGDSTKRVSCGMRAGRPRRN